MIRCPTCGRALPVIHDCEAAEAALGELTVLADKSMREPPNDTKAIWVKVSLELVDDLILKEWIGPVSVKFERREDGSYLQTVRNDSGAL